MRDENKNRRCKTKYCVQVLTFCIEISEGRMENLGTVFHIIQLESLISQCYCDSLII